jgi:hypothetical protein
MSGYGADIESLRVVEVDGAWGRDGIRCFDGSGGVDIEVGVDRLCVDVDEGAELGVDGGGWGGVEETLLMAGIQALE